MTAALVSIHDVMPETLSLTADILRLIERSSSSFATLLVVPGRAWNEKELSALRRWQDAGHEIAAHGWVHQCGKISSLYHRAHSLCLSRNVAEHLSLESRQVVELMLRAAEWFEKKLHHVPSLYVPPAWALGSVEAVALEQLPYLAVETLSGLLFPAERRRMRLPLLGFEADSLVRAIVLKSFNRTNLFWASTRDRPYRLAIHPYDLEFRLGRQLIDQLTRVTQWLLYGDLISNNYGTPRCTSSDL